MTFHNLAQQNQPYRVYTILHNAHQLVVTREETWKGQLSITQLEKNKI